MPSKPRHAKGAIPYSKVGLERPRAPEKRPVCGTQRSERQKDAEVQEQPGDPSVSSHLELHSPLKWSSRGPLSAASALRALCKQSLGMNSLPACRRTCSSRMYSGVPETGHGLKEDVLSVLLLQWAAMSDGNVPDVSALEQGFDASRSVLSTYLFHASFVHRLCQCKLLSVGSFRHGMMRSLQQMPGCLPKTP